ncbi:MAG TPA: tRNA pseudouridine(38-40) synthase TruA [Brevundimonas sp.]|uniref:tRNA pseudouridine(38-40) synthase TruA n=1 Tax=Brevundimonas sp. TaxID=1871086 RepID=UPI00260B04D2|nr:tRNA pseudouridine(38-40) synthase TruA [Brevundimonas sp.]HRO32783.1 tRNA pseudouridine(38-40) synthase TruA [Brevundimonas sp.]
MPRYRATVEYDGSAYNGFQAQAGQPTVQGVIETAITAFCGETVRIAAAGRTDTGVHATGQVVSFDLDRDWPARTVMNALNAHMVEQATAVLDCAVVDGDWHARFSATGRRYLYRILNRPGRPALDRGRVWHVKGELDVAAMSTAAAHLVGRHDFTTFRDAGCQAASPEKTLDVARVERVGEEAHLHFAARSFLHRQVRSMTGSLVQVGLGRWSPEDLKAALDARDRAACGPVAPSDGLYLTGVEYG